MDGTRLVAASMVMSVIVLPNESSEQEPTCYSRFDYDHKVLTTLVSLETEQTRLRGVVETQELLLTALQNEIKELKSGSSDISIKLRGLESHLSIEGTGNVFTRWGRTSCPGNGTELIYDGYAAGSHFTDNGAAANYLCLPKNPIWNKWRDGSQNGPSVFGAEYEFDDIDRTAFFGHEVRDNDVPCAVCRTKRSSVMMIPARNECFDGWTMEYSGYLSGDRPSHAAATEYVCLDEELESLVGGHGSANGRLFYIAEARCGSLRCPPYHQDRELTCVVCSK